MSTPLKPNGVLSAQIPTAWKTAPSPALSPQVSPRTPQNRPAEDAASAKKKLITSVERPQRPSTRQGTPPSVITSTVSHRYQPPPTPNSASQMAGLFSPGYPLGAEPCVRACHHHPSANGSMVHHSHAHPQHAHGIAASDDAMHLYGNDEYTFAIDECDKNDEFDPFLFIATLPAGSPAEAQGIPRALRPKSSQSPRITLVLDLDETLVHCSTDASETLKPDFVFDVNFNGMVYKVAVNRRPFFQEFLEFCRSRFEVVLFTASQRVYADRLLDILDPGHRLISARLFRDSCVFVEGNFLKDLTVLGRDLSKTIIIDNSPQAFAYQLDNGVPIVSWFDCEEDRELLKLIPFLAKLQHVDDVRPHLKKRFQLRECVIARYNRHRARNGGCGF